MKVVRANRCFMAEVNMYSPTHIMQRDFTVEEKAVISFLLRAAGKDESYISKFFLETQCCDMTDGRMGSIQFVHLGLNPSSDARKFGGEMSSCHFTDDDGVLVSVVLYADTSGIPFELDVWKVDFSPLIRIPNDISKFVLDASRRQEGAKADD